MAFYSFFSENDAMRALRVNQNSKVVVGQMNNELKLIIVQVICEDYVHFFIKA